MGVGFLESKRSGRGSWVKNNGKEVSKETPKSDTIE